MDGPNDDGVVKVDIEDALIMLRGERSIIGRSVVLHGVSACSLTALMHEHEERLNRDVSLDHRVKMT